MKRERHVVLHVEPVGLDHALEVSRDGEGKVTKTLNIIDDVTERKRAEEALRRSEARLQQALDKAFAGAPARLEVTMAVATDANPGVILRVPPAALV